jgi:hypothetical protein
LKGYILLGAMKGKGGKKGHQPYDDAADVGFAVADPYI